MLNRSFGARQLPYFFMSRSRPHARALLAARAQRTRRRVRCCGAGRREVAARSGTCDRPLRGGDHQFGADPAGSGHLSHRTVIMASGVAVGSTTLPRDFTGTRPPRPRAGGPARPPDEVGRHVAVAVDLASAAVGPGASAGLLFGQPSRGASAQRMIAAMKPCVSSGEDRRLGERQTGIRKARQAKRRQPRVASSSPSSRISTTVAAIIPR